MKFSNAVLLSLAAGSARAFAPVAPRHQQTRLFSTTEKEAETKSSKKDDRLRMMKSDQFHRKGFKEVREGAEKRLENEYMSDLVKDLKSSNYVMEKDGVKVYLAKVSVSPV